MNTRMDSGNGGESRAGARSAGDGDVSAPAISLPAGGGAIRGIGEKLSVNLPTGTASMTVPIAVSPGRSGFAPDLSLSYDSSAGNGIFGFGWRLSLPSIGRKTDSGVPRYDDAGESDVFLLTGADDLVPSLVEKNPGEWCVDESERDGYRIRRYRPRTEGPLTRIERWMRMADGDTHWRTFSRENVLSVYGFETGSRIADPGDPARIVSWLICESYDGSGNAILYEYAADDGASVVNCRQRQRPAASANRYPKRILYGNRKPLLIDASTTSFRRPHTERPDFDDAGWMFEAVFDYGEGHCRPRPAGTDGRVFVDASAAIPEGSSWAARRDPFSVYRSGFEVRTHRLCRSVLAFHHFPDELGVADCLVRATHFTYDEKPCGSFMRRVVQAGYRRGADGADGADGGYLERPLPALELRYAPNPLEDPTYDGRRLREMTVKSVDRLPAGVDSRTWKWVDLDGEGIPGVLSLQADAWYYKRNLGGGRLGPLEPVAARPSYGPRASIGTGVAREDARVQLLDLTGDGRLELVDLGRSTPGFFGRDESSGWSGFRAFSSWPNLAWDDPNVRLVDLTGDGRADILVTADDALTIYPSLGDEGFGSPVRVPLPGAGDKGMPRIVFAGDIQSLFLADMSGDGLHDLVRIRNGEIAYWPNLGYGRFGTMVSMDDAPWFDRPEMFDPRRLRLGDTDGSGTTDIAYIGGDAIRIYLNQSGNAWSDARVLERFPGPHDHTAVELLDLLGRGTACLCWSSPLPGHAREPLRYVDLMDGQKPHLLVEMRNQRGTETVLHYASSTEFYLRDNASGEPWATRLPFPLQVVDRIETYDRVSHNRFVTRYSYHHGHFDGTDRELCGFGRVDQLDTEELAALAEPGTLPAGNNFDAASHLPPVLTQTWFHTGGTPRTPAETALPEGLDADEGRAACRALRGSVSRCEVCALDGSSSERRPYVVDERRYTLRRLQPRAGRRPPVFLAHARERMVFEYERHLADAGGMQRADPRVVHTMTLDADDFGNALSTASIAYGRRTSDPDPLLTDDDRREQGRTRVTFTACAFTNVVNLADAWRVPALHETRVFELQLPLHDGAKRTAIPGITNLFRLDELRALIAAVSDGSHDRPYESYEDADARAIDARGTDAHDTAPFRRLIDHVRVTYRRNDLTSALPPGSLESLALPFETRKLAFPASLTASLFVASGKLDAAGLDDALTAAGYVRERDGGWWITSRRVAYSPGHGDTPAEELRYAARHFFLACRYLDPYGNVTSVSYDPHDLLLRETCDPVGNRVTAGVRDAADRLVRAGNDYRVLKPVLLMDANRNLSAAAFDALGMVAGTAIMGKPEHGTGDSLEGFEPDVPDDVIAAHFADPLAAPQALLQRATRRVVVDLAAYARTAHGPQPQPLAICQLARRTHAADGPPDGQTGQTTAIQQSFLYRDGFGRETQKKEQAGDRRWIASGWTIFNNKGGAVRKYQPFFDDTHAFRSGHAESAAATTFFDPLGRTIGVLHPNHAWEKVHTDPWRHESWDVNDTVLVPNPIADAVVGAHFRRLPPAAYLPTWYGARHDGALGPAERDAAEKAAAHAGTPVVNYLDPLGRVFLTVTHNRRPHDDTPSNPLAVEERLRTRIVYDIEGNQRRIVDALGRTIARYDYDLLGNRVHSASMDAGERWMLLDAGGQPVRAWDSRGHAFVTAYDAARRPTSRTVRGSDPSRSDPRTLDRDVLFELTEYGENQPDDIARNLRTRVFRNFQGSGVRTNDRYDIQGNAIVVCDSFTEEYKELPDWAGSPAPMLQSESYVCRYGFDALNRITTIAAPDGSIARIAYEETSRLRAIDVHARGTAAPTPVVRGVDYNAQGQRTRIAYGNGATSTFEYDPQTFKLTRLTTTRQCSATLDASPLFTAPGTVQDLRLTYDPIGNITAVVDDALATVIDGNQEVRAEWPYRYDAIYRLIEAAGREHHHAGDLQALVRYIERYRYDAAGNILEIAHRTAARCGWTRAYSYEEPSLLEPERPGNRLSAASVGDVEPYDYDDHGNMTRMAHLPRMEWSFKNELAATSRQVGTAREITYFGYAADGRRTRKITERQNGTRRSERLYFDGWEIDREYAGDGTTVAQARESLHIFDGRRRIAIIDTQTIVDGRAVDAPTPAHAARYQLGNHLGSVCLELDQSAALISYEEYTPYGSPALQAGASAAEVRRRRYGYVARERDPETGFGHHGARYYVPWLGRWSSCDPAGLVAERNAAYLVSCKQLDSDSRRYPFDPRVSRWSARDPIVSRGAGQDGGGTKSRRAIEWPQNWNLYGYANDNPATLVDTNGRLTTGDIVGALIGIGIMAGLVIATMLLLPTASARWIYLGVTVIPALAMISAAFFTAALEEARVVRVRSADRITAFSEGRVFDFWALGHYFMPAFFSGLLTALLARFTSLSPEDIYAISGFTTMALAYGWEMIERPVVHAHEYASNIVGDVVIGSIGGLAASYGVLLALGRPVDIGLTIGLGLFIPVWGGVLTAGFINNGVIHPTRDEPAIGGA